MSLAPGTRLGPYDVTTLLGAGGMGEVYRARDKQLQRDVALKVLPEVFAQDTERLARFKREAQVLASLNHPHIAQIHGLEVSAASSGRLVHALVMELVEGPTLADRVAQGALPLDEALAIATQIAEGLEAAHEQGIVHRDLKPANIKMRADGTVKLLDFGLAKAMEPPGASGVLGLSQSPTITTPAMTHAGVILGTAAYMSPEQARGRPVDKRTDIWAFGCVVYEMLTGRRAFEGEDVAGVLARVIEREPDMTALPAATPPAVRRLLRRCLTKDRKRRLSDIVDGVLDIEDARSGSAADRNTNLAAAHRSDLPASAWRRFLPWTVTALSVAGLMLATGAPWRTAPQPSIARFTIPLPEGQAFTNVNRHLVAISPDGSTIAYVANRQLYLRPLSGLEATSIAGDETVGISSPAFSPDGRSLAFWSGTDRKIKTIGVSGGPPASLCDASEPFGLTWGAEGILFSLGGGGVMRVPATGGTPERLVAIAERELAHGPHMLPGGDAVLFTLVTGDTFGNARVVVHSLRTGVRKTLVDGGSDARYLATGHVVYARAGVLMAAPFDVQKLDVTGPTVPVLEGVRRARANVTGAAMFSISERGTMVYLRGPASGGQGQFSVTWWDSQGNMSIVPIAPDAYEAPRLSPDGKWLAVGTNDERDAIVWVSDVAAKTSRRRLTFGGRNRFPVWSGDSQRVAFQSDREGDLAVWSQRADGTGAAERMTKPESGVSHTPQSWSADGRTLLFTATQGASSSLWTLSVPDKQAEPFGDVRGLAGSDAAFSPDGRWVVYEQNERGPGEWFTFVQPYPATGAKYQIAGGISPAWSPRGTHIVFDVFGKLRSVDVTTQPVFAFGNPVPLARTGVGGGSGGRNYDISLDGSRILGLVPGVEVLLGGEQIHVVLNWFEELKARVPVR